MPAGHVAVTRPAAVRQSDRGDHADIRIHGRDDRVQRDPASNFPPLINANGAPDWPHILPGYRRLDRFPIQLHRDQTRCDAVLEQRRIDAVRATGARRHRCWCQLAVAGHEPKRGRTLPATTSSQKPRKTARFDGQCPPSLYEKHLSRAQKSSQLVMRKVEGGPRAAFSDFAQPTNVPGRPRTDGGEDPCLRRAVR